LTSISELREIETLLNTFETTLGNFYKVLPKLDRRRSLTDFGGTILKTLFRMATTTDTLLLHETIVS